MATKETVKLTNVLFGEKTFSAIEQNVGADADSLDEVIDGNKNIDVVNIAIEIAMFFSASELILF